MQSVSFIFLISLALATCVPTSVLVKDSVAEHNYKVKRSSSNNDNELSTQKSSKQNSGQTIINKNSEIELPMGTSIDFVLKNPQSSSQPDINSIYQKGSSLSSGNNNVEDYSLYNSLKGKSPLHKRGVNSQLLYGSDFYNPSLSSGHEDGVWGDEIDPSYIYSTDSDLDEYPVRGQYRNKPYDNLQNILNSEAQYHQQEPLALPIQYYLNDRRKRSNKYKNGYDMRLKRDSSTKLTPADMLALVALVEAGERDDLDYNKPTSYYPSQLSDNDMLNSWTLPLENDNNEQQQGYYSGMPYNLETIPRYEILRDQKYSPNRYGNSKRFMVSKKKRSLGYFYNEPIAKPSISYTPPLQENLFGKGPKNLKKYI